MKSKQTNSTYDYESGNEEMTAGLPTLDIIKTILRCELNLDTQTCQTGGKILFVSTRL